MRVRLGADTLVRTAREVYGGSTVIVRCEYSVLCTLGSNGTVLACCLYCFQVVQRLEVGSRIHFGIEVLECHCREVPGE